MPADPQSPQCVMTIAALGPLFTAGATIIVGLAVAFIAYRQWRIAHEKLILDLFDKRFAVYSEAIAAVEEFFEHSRPPGKDSSINTLFSGGTNILARAQVARVAALREAGRKAKFLFGDEVAERIYQARDVLLQAIDTDLEKKLSDPKVEAFKSPAWKAAIAEVDDFPQDLFKLVLKYMRSTRAL